MSPKYFFTEKNVWHKFVRIFGEIAMSGSRNFLLTICFDLYTQGVQLSDWKGVKLVRGEEKG